MHRAKSTGRLAAMLTVLASLSTGLAQNTPRVAAIGDSLTDEYAEQTYGLYARSWTQILVQTGRIDMGPVAENHAPQGWWGEPRRSGYEFNWARYANTTEEALAFGQHTGAASSVSVGGAQYVVIFIGGNDYAPWSFGTYDNIYYERWTPAQVQAFNDQRLAHYRTILDTLAPTGAKVVLASVPDFSFMPFVWMIHQSVIARGYVANVLSEFRDRTRALARERGLVFVDTFQLYRDMYGRNPVQRTSLLIGNVPIRLHIGAQAPDAGFVEDTAHPHTVLQAIVASTFATALRGGFGALIAPIPEAEMLAIAGLTYGGADTLGQNLRPLRGYVQNFACPADINLDRVVGVQDVFDFLGVYFAGDTRADLDGNLNVDIGDIFAFLSSYFTPCP